MISKRYVALTLGAMRQFGVLVEEDGLCFRVPGGQRYGSPGSFMIEGDACGAKAFPDYFTKFASVCRTA